MSANQKLLFCLDSRMTVALDVDDIWPNGDAPESPTAEDAVAEIAKLGPPPRAMEKLGLSHLLEITVLEPGSKEWRAAVHRWGNSDV